VVIGTKILLEIFLSEDKEKELIMLARLYSLMACLLKFIAKVEMTLLMAILIVIFELGLLLIIPLQCHIEGLFIF
jgi:hypothetical protein